MYKIINDHAASNVKQSFRLYSDSGVARVIVLGGGGGKMRAPKARAILGGSGGMLLWKILKSRVPQMRFPAFSG